MALNRATFFAPILIFYFLILVGLSTADPSKQFCGSNGWTIWRGNCYKIFTHPHALIFPEAELICQASGSHAASVHSEAENRFIASVAKEHFQPMEPGSWSALYTGLWLGYRRVRNPGTGKFRCFNTDGTPMDYAEVTEPGTAMMPMGTQAKPPGYPWIGANPDNEWDGKPEECVEMLNFPGDHYGTWNDMHCTVHTLSGVVCKKPVKCQ